MQDRPSPVTFRQSLIAAGILLTSLGCFLAGSTQASFILTLLALVSMVALMGYVPWTCRGRASVSLRLTRFGLLPTVCGIVMALGLWFFAGELMELWLAWRGQASSFVDPARTQPLLYLVIGAPILEELFFRGYLLTGFRQGMGDRAAILATAILFAIFHLNAAGTPIYLATGLVTAWLTVRTGSIFPAMICHAFGNMSSMWHLPSPLSVIGSLPLSETWQMVLYCLGNGLFVLAGGYGIWWSTRQTPPPLLAIDRESIRSVPTSSE